MKKMFFMTVLAFCMVLVSAGCVCNCNTAAATAATQSPKYVFLFIGDGMGKQHVELARQIYGNLNMDKLPVKGSVSTVNVSKSTTDSAASGTAFACGMKTSNGRLGTDPQGNSVDSSAVLAKKQGRMVAILTTVGVNNATPAAFYAHVDRRGESKKIMEQFPASGIDLLIGEQVDGMNSKMKQEDFLSGDAYLAGNNVRGNADSIKNKGIRVFAWDEKPFFALNRLESPVLLYTRDVHYFQKYVRKAIELMQDSPTGFFMMAEGGHIDHGGHGNNGQYMLGELKEFDSALAVALEFYRKHPEDTLIVVSADHHTGGLRLSGKAMPNYPDQTWENMKLSYDDPENVILSKLEKNGIKCTAEETAKLDKIMKAEQKKQKNSQLVKFIRNTVDAHSGITWITTGHTMDEVYLFAIGKGAEQFAGKQENSDVGAKLKALFAPAQ